MADQQFVEDATKGPEVGRVVVRLLLNQLWGHVERGALLCADFKMQIPNGSDLDGGEHESVESQIPCKPKITKLGSAFTVQ